MAKLIAWVIVLFQCLFWVWPFAYFIAIGLARLKRHHDHLADLERKYRYSQYR